MCACSAVRTTPRISIFSLLPSVPRFLLALVVCVGIPASAPAHSLPSDTTNDDRWRFYAPVGGANVNITALNQQLSATGYPTFTSLVPSIGAGAARRVGTRLFLGGEGHIYPWGTGQSSTGRALTLRGGYALATIGYRLRPLSRLPALSLHPQVGAGGGTLQLRLSGVSRSVSDFLQSPPSSGTLQRWSLLVSAAMTVEYRFLRNTPAHVRVGLNAGYLAAPTSTSWQVNGAQIPGGPSANLDGPFLRLVIGRSW